MIRPGVVQVDYQQTPLMLQRKSLPQHNVLIGYDPVQTRFVEKLLGKESILKTSLTDEDVLGKDDTILYRIESSRNLDISPAVKAKIGLWSLEPLVAGSSGINAIVRFAATTLGRKAEAAVVNQVAKELGKSEIWDVEGAVYQAMSLLLEDPNASGRWPDPWEKPTQWIPKGVDLGFRMNSLYHVLVGFVFARDNETEATRKLNISPSRLARFKKMSLDMSKVDSTIRELSRWRAARSSAEISALKISKIWG